jgi:hypothetical protein
LIEENAVYLLENKKHDAKIVERTIQNSTNIRNEIQPFSNHKADYLFIANLS